MSSSESTRSHDVECAQRRLETSSLQDVLELLQMHSRNIDAVLHTEECDDIVESLHSRCHWHGISVVHAHEVRGTISEALCRRVLDNIQREIGKNLFELLHQESWNVKQDSARFLKDDMTLKITPWHCGIIYDKNEKPYAEVDAVIRLGDDRLALLQASMSHRKTVIDCSQRRARYLAHPFREAPLLPAVMTGDRGRAPRIREISGTHALYLSLLGCIRRLEKNSALVDGLAQKGLSVVYENETPKA